MKSAMLCLCLLWAGFAQALPAALQGGAADWRNLGQGEMRWFGLRLYDAELWAAGAAYDPAQSFALRIRYARAFAGERLARTSIDEMRRLGWQGAELLARWQAEMQRIFPDVNAGDVLTGVFEPGRGARFYLGERLLGEVADPEFARAFAAIWLDPRTREPGLRRQLLGQAP